MPTSRLSEPSVPPGPNGRTSRGTFAPGNRHGAGNRNRFRPGNKFAKGNPFAKRVQELRRALYEETTIEDIRAVVRKMIEMAKRGDSAAQKLFLDRVLGRDPSSVLQVLDDDIRIRSDVRDEENEDGDYDPKGW